MPFEAVDVTPVESAADPQATVVRNPLLVAPLEAGSFLLLDESPRLAQLIADGIKQVPVQICLRSQVQIYMESLALFGVTPEHIDEFIAHADGLIQALAADEALAPEFLPVVIDFQDGRQVPLAVARADKGGCPPGLLRLMAEIDAVGRYAPYLSEWYTVDPLVRCARADAVLFPPRLTLQDLCQAALSGVLVPPGLVRVGAEDRILAVDFPLSVLRSAMPIEQKTAFLHDLISLRRQANRTSIVQGRVYILNL